MNDPNIMSLFDGDTNLLDEITGLNSDLLGQDLGPLPQSEQLLPPEPQPQQQAQQPQHIQQSSFMQMQNAAPLPHQNISQGMQPSQQQQQQQQRLHHLEEFNFSSTGTTQQKLHHISDQGYMQNMNTGMNNAPQQMNQTPQYQQSNDGFVQNFQGNQQAVLNNFNPMWSQTQQNTNQISQNTGQQFIQEQANPNYQVPPYLTHHGHDYALPPNHVAAQQRPQQQQPQQQRPQLPQQQRPQLQPQPQQQQPVQPPPQQQSGYRQYNEPNNQGTGFIQASNRLTIGQTPVNTHANRPSQPFPSPSHSQGLQINRQPTQQMQQSQQTGYQAVLSGTNQLPAQRPAIQQTINRPITSQASTTYKVVQSNAMAPQTGLVITRPGVGPAQIRTTLNKVPVQQFQQFTTTGQRPTAQHQGERTNPPMTHFSANPNSIQRQPEPQFMQNFTPTSTNLQQRSMVPHSMHLPTSSHSMPPTSTDSSSQGNFVVNSNIVPPPVSNNSTETLGNPFDIPMAGGPVGQPPNSMQQQQQPSASTTYSTPGYTVPTTTASVMSLTPATRTTANVSTINLNLQGKIQQIQIKQLPNQGSVQQVILQRKPAQEFVPLAPAPTAVVAQKPPPATFQPVENESDRSKLRKQQQAQEKANRICAEAMAKAQAAGIQNVTFVVNASESTEVCKEEIPPPKPEKKKEIKPKKIVTARKKPTKKPPPPPKIKKLLIKRKTGEDSGESGGSDLDETPPPSPEDDAFSLKRRSARNTKRKRYTEDYDYNISDEEDKDVDVEGLTDTNQGPTFIQPTKFFVENPDESESFIVDKILAIRKRKKEQIPGEAQVGEVEEFLVKYKNFSYLHCEWATTNKLERDKRIHMKIKRFRAKQSYFNFFQELDDEPFNPDYIEVDRVLEITESEDYITGQPVTHCLVKWRSLPYEESTWELKDDVDDDRIQDYYAVNKLPSSDERERVDRPSKEDWEKLTASRTYKNGNTLREYQLEGVNWLTFSWFNRQNCILADEMGLGKTIQSITFLLEVQSCGIRGPFLVIAPLSTIANWQREFETWSNMNCVVYHGSATSRRMIQEYEMHFKNEKGQRVLDCHKFQVLVTTYEIILADTEVLSQIEWRCAVIDEAHRLKNKNCKLLEGLKLLDLEHRVLLTGTPLQNNVEELFSLLNFLEPGRFHSLTDFLGDFGDLKTEGQVEKLQQILKPMMLRRLKEDVEKNLAPKEETIIEVELTNIQKKYYRAILERNFSFLSKGVGSTANVPNLMNTMMELRKCCNHPFLINGAEEKIMLDFPEDFHLRQLQALIQSAGKMVLLDKLLPKLREGGHKVLVFSQMVRCLDILEDYLLQRRYPYERIDGRVRGNMRQAAIDRFSKPDSDRFVFLLCTRAGGLGINLTAADTVIIFDSDWNPQNDLQAQARCHRIGQVKAVKVYRLITRNSYEREMFDKASLKLGLDKAVLQSMRHDKETATSQQSALSKKEIEELLRKGAYGAIMDDDDAGSKFCEEDIDQILQRRTQVIQIESEGKGSTFAKASFVSSSDRQDISLDDPDFWSKWAKKADVNMDEIKSRDIGIINEPRRRKQTKRFGNSDEVLEFTSESESEEEEKVSKKQLQTGWTRVECFRVEKGLLTYGWGRWEDIIKTGKFKRKLGEKDVEAVSRTILVYCLQYYKGDEKIKSFIWDLVKPSGESVPKSYKNHLGLANPVPRGRKGKKAKKENKVVPALLEYDFSSRNTNPEELLQDPGYKNHLKRHCNKVLLRVRMLYYLKQEIIGDLVSKIAQGSHATTLPLPVPCPEGDPPIGWWDDEADRSLMVGVFKHGYEKYSLVRGDPSLCFLNRCGPPDASSLRMEEDGDDEDALAMDEDPDFKPVQKLIREDLDLDDSMSPSSVSTPQPSPRPTKSTHKKVEPPTAPGKLPFPAASDLNTRLRRLVTSLQRNHKKQQLKQAARERKEAERKHRFEEALKQKELKKKEQAQRWSRREESDFYRTVSAFGVEYNPKTDKYTWNNFRKIARLDKKTEEKLQEYYENFRAMCLRVSRRHRKREAEGEGFYDDPNSADEMQFNQTLHIDPISEERANKCLQRIDLLLKVRNEIMPHPELDERLKLCQPSMELPEWWEPGKHDKDILTGVARYGINRGESQHQMMNDPDLSFHVLKEKLEEAMSAQTPLDTSVPSSQNDNADDTQESEVSLPTDQKIKTEIKTEPNASVTSDLHANDEETTSENVKIEIKSENVALKSESEEYGDSKELSDDNCDDMKVEVTEDSSGGENSNLSLLRQELTKPSLVTGLPMLQDENSQDSFSMESSSQPTVAMLLNTNLPPIIRWPKDKVIIHRLEQIIHCVENNQWPARRGHYHHDAMSSLDQQLDQSIDSPLMGGLDTSDLSLTGDLEAISKLSKESGGLKMTIQKKRKRRKKAEIEAERAKLAELLSGKPMSGLPQSDGNLSDDTCGSLPSLPDIPQLAKLPPLFCDTPPLDGVENTVEGIANGTAAITPDMIGTGILGADKKTGRKRKHHGDKEEKKRKKERKEIGDKPHKRRKKKQKFEERGRWTPTNLEDDDPVPVVNTAEGIRLNGLAAPLKKDVGKWLQDHPGYVIDYPPQPDPTTELLLHNEDDKKEKKRRKRTPNPSKLDISQITGEEKVCVINRNTGRKVTGKKAPTVSTLSEWLEKNPDFDIPAEWGPIVKEKSNLSPAQLNRIIPSAIKGGGALLQPATFRSSSDNPLTLTSLGIPPSTILGAFPGGKFPLNPGFPNVGMGQLGMNPLLGYAGFGGLSTFPMGMNKDTSDDDDEDDDISGPSVAHTAASSKTMPFLFPSAPGLFYSPFITPQGFLNPAAIATAGLVNGIGENSSKGSSPKGDVNIDDNSSAKRGKSKPEIELGLGEIDTSDIDDIEETLDDIPDDEDLEENEDDFRLDDEDTNDM